MAETETEPTSPQPPTAKPKTPKAPPRIEVKVSWCKGCGLCVDYCKLGVLEMDGALPKVVKLERCTRCMQCEVICPDFAIRVLDAPVGETPAATADEKPGKEQP